ncbi:MAG: sulfite exporter TauE/SafE family protein [Gaiellaceae bacterium]
MKRLVVLAACLAALLAPAAVQAHPLGNFTTNRYSELVVSGDRLYAVYVLDLAEIPTFQEKSVLARLGRDGYAERLAGQIERGFVVRAAGHRLPLRELERRLEFPQGVGGLKTTRLELVFDAGPAAAVRQLSVNDETFARRVGWKEIVIRADLDARVSSASVPAETSSDRLRTYPQDLLKSPLDLRTAQAVLQPGTKRGVPPSLGDSTAKVGRTSSKSEGGFAGLIAHDDLGLGFVLVALLVAMFWGAAHALTPGHGKAIIAGYMVGSRGKPRHAFLLGGIVTVTHTIGVFALGLVTLGLSEFIVPEDLYPWLNLVSALLVVSVGMIVLRSRYRAANGHAHGHHDHGHSHDGEHGHSHVPEPGSGMRGLVAAGISGGILPCPTALVVLLAAISLHRVAFGLLLIVAFSIGLAAVVSGIGLLAIGAQKTFKRMNFEGPIVRALPAVSALLILGLGVLMTVRALPNVI